ncbi:MAG: hypothetical protein GX660_22860, partial [Clostridiaceae bacterium]|nr:hypothetical protein [Clostridiaceae bacterium]
MSNKNQIIKINNLSPMQEGMLFHYLLDRETSAYIGQTTFDVEGELDTDLFEKSFNSIIERYEIFRTIFVTEKVKKPVQVVLKERKTRIVYQDICHLDDAQRTLYIEDYKKADRHKSFDLSRDVLIRFHVLKTGDKLYKVIVSNHHIVMDGWCIGIVLKEMFQFYEQLKNGTKTAFEKVTPYSDYIKWLEKQDREEGLDYWRNYLDGYEIKAGMPRWRGFNIAGKYNKNEYCLKFDPQTT